MRIDTTSPLAFDGKTAVINHLRQQLRRPLDETFVSFTLDPTNAVLTVRSLERSTTGEYGRYSGSESLSYQKVSLETCLPYSIPYRGEYPCSFAMLRGWLEQQYGIVLDPGEFALSASPSALIDSDIIATPLDPIDNLLRLVALTTSARFTAGSQLRIMMIPSNGKRWLPGLIPSTLTFDAIHLAQSTPENRSVLYARNLYNSAADEIAVELLWREYGFTLDTNSANLAITSSDPTTVTVAVTARPEAVDGSRSAYNGTTSFHYRKVLLDSLIPHDMVFDGAYPVTFARLKQYLQYTYDLFIEESQFRLEGGSQTPLIAAALIDTPLNSEGEIVLVATNQSLKWIAGSRLRLRVV